MNAQDTLHHLMLHGGSHGLVTFDQEKNQFLILTEKGTMQHVPYSLAEIAIRKFNGAAIYDTRTKDLRRI